MAILKTGRIPANENCADLDPLAVTIPTACKLTSVARSTIYREIGSGRLTAIKAGKRTLIPMTAIKEWLAKLPQIAA